MDRIQLQKHLVALEQGDHVSRRHAIHALRQHGEQDWVDAPVDACSALVVSLRQQLESSDKPPIFLKDVAAILGTMGAHSRPAVPTLIALLRDGVPDVVRESAVIALGKTGRAAQDAVDHLAEFARGRNAIAVQAIRALGSIGCADQRVRTALTALWATPNHAQDIQLQVAVTLCRLQIDASGLVPFVTHLLMSSSESLIRKAMAGALAWCDSKDMDVVPALLTAALHDKDEGVRQVADASLQQLRLTHEKAVVICAKQLKHSRYADTALRRAGQLGVAALIEALRAPDSVVRLKAAQTLGFLGEVAIEAKPALEALLHDEDPVICLAAAKGLWCVTKQAERVVPVLIQLLDNKSSARFEDPEVRRQHIQTVMEALWRIGPPAQSALPALIDKTKDKNRLIRESASEAMRRIASTAVSSNTSKPDVPHGGGARA